MNNTSISKKQKIPREEIDALINYVQMIANEINMEKPRTYRAIKLIREISLNCLENEKEIMTLLGLLSSINLRLKSSNTMDV